MDAENNSDLAKAIDQNTKSNQKLAETLDLFIQVITPELKKTDTVRRVQEERNALGCTEVIRRMMFPESEAKIQKAILEWGKYQEGTQMFRMNVIGIPIPGKPGKYRPSRNAGMADIFCQLMVGGIPFPAGLKSKPKPDARPKSRNCLREQFQIITSCAPSMTPRLRSPMYAKKQWRKYVSIYPFDRSAIQEGIAIDDYHNREINPGLSSTNFRHISTSPGIRLPQADAPWKADQGYAGRLDAALDHHGAGNL